MDIDTTHLPTNGITLHVAQAGPNDGDLTILLHGFPEFWYGWRHQIPALAEAGLRVWAPDQRGYNLSDKPRGIKAYRIDELAKDVIGLLDAAGVDKAHIVGHDWGAAVAWWVALRYPERVRKLAILNVPHPQVMLRTLRRNRKQLLKSWYIFFFQIPRLPEFLIGLGNWQGAATMLKQSSRHDTFSQADLLRYREAWSQPEAFRSMLNWYRAVVQRQPQLPLDPRVGVPTLIIWGERDVALSRDMAPASAALCNDVQLALIEEATHWVQHDAAERVNALLVEFLT